MEHYRVDSEHSNAFTVWKSLGAPESLSSAQGEQLEKAAQLQLLNSPEWMSIENGIFKSHFELPRQGLSLIRLAW